MSVGGPEYATEVCSYAAAEIEPHPELSITVDRSTDVEESVDLRLRADGFAMAVPLEATQVRDLIAMLERAEGQIRTNGHEQ